MQIARHKISFYCGAYITSANGYKNDYQSMCHAMKKTYEELGVFLHIPELYIPSVSVQVMLCPDLHYPV